MNELDRDEAWENREWEREEKGKRRKKGNERWDDGW